MIFSIVSLHIFVVSLHVFIIFIVISTIASNIFIFSIASVIRARIEIPYVFPTLILRRGILTLIMPRGIPLMRLRLCGVGAA